MRWILLGALFLSLACGSRSALFDSTGGAEGGSGGSGAGGASDCSAFAIAGPTSHVQNPGGSKDSTPAFVNPPGDTANVTLAFQRRPSTGPGEPTLTHVSFPAWGEWPPAPKLGSGFASLASEVLDAEYRVASSLDGKLAAAAMLSGVITFAPQINTSTVGTGSTLPLLGVKPLFVSELDDQAFVIGTMSIQRELYVQIADPTLQDPVPIATIGCATDDIVGGAVPFANGWLLAHSNGAHAPAAVCEPPATTNAGSATRIDIVKLERSSITQLLASIDASAFVSELVVAPHPDGIAFAWIDGAVHWARYVAKTGAVVGPIVVSPATEPNSGLSMTALGGRSLLLYTRWTGTTAVLETKLLDATGTERVAVTLTPYFLSKATIVGGPGEDAFLVAYQDDTELMAIDRLNCAP